MERVLSQFSAAFSTVLHLDLEFYLDPEDYLDEDDQPDGAFDVEWLHLLRQFPAMQMLHVREELAASIFLALEEITAKMVAEVLPSLSLICIEGETALSLEEIVAIYRLSGRPITVAATKTEFNERVASYISG